MKLLLLSLVLCTTSALAQPRGVADRIHAVENGLIPFVPVNGFPKWKLADRMAYYKVPAVSIAVIDNYRLDWAKSYGLADTLRRLPATNETIYSAGSVSKLVTAVMALQLVAEGKMELDTPINQYLRSWRLVENAFTQTRPVTLRMLLSHTAGTSQSAYFGFTPDKNPLPTIADVLSGAAIAESRPVVVNSAPGKEFRYSGGGYMVVQQAIMDLLGADFETIARRRVFDPLQMRHSTFAQPLPAANAAKAAWGYSAAPWYKGMPYVYPQQAAAGLHTSATDLALFFIDLQLCFQGKGKLLPQAIARQMLAPQAIISTGGYTEEMGLGAFLLQRSGNTYTGGRYFEHQGANAGFIAYAIGSAEGGKGVVILMNTGDDFNGFGKELRRAVADTYNWVNFLPPVIQPAKTDTAVLNSYAGRYRMGADDVVYLRRENNYLVERINEGNEIYCFPAGTDSLVFTDFNVKGWFGRDAAGSIVSLQSQYQDKPMPRMRPDEFSPSELLRAKKYAAAKEGFRQMNWNEYQITYKAYELLNKKPFDADAVKAILELASVQHPRSAIVYSRWGDYYLRVNEKARALESFQAAARLDPGDEEVRKQVVRLQQ